MSDLGDLFNKDHSLEDELKFDCVKIPDGKRKGMVLCPLHKDKNPSLSIDLEAGSWHCFAGCGEGGVAEYIAKRDNIASGWEVIVKWAKEKGVWKEEYKSNNGDASSNGNGEHKPKPVVPLNWKECVDKFNEGCQKRLCELRGYSEKFVGHLVANRMIGICDGHLSFPIHTNGKVTGTHQKVEGGWIIKGGSVQPWVIGDHDENILIFESQWDAFTLMDEVKWFDTHEMRSVFSIVITRGASNGKLVAGTFKAHSKIYIWMQNDKPNDKGVVPSDSWLATVIKIVRKANLCVPPLEHKDLNEWVQTGTYLKGDIFGVMDKSEVYRDPTAPPLPPPLDFHRMIKFNPQDDATCLIGNRYLCQGGSAIWVGGSGLGKSVITFQTAIQLALGENMLGLEPRRPLKSVIFSAEDDEGDLSETLQGVLHGMGITESDPRFQTVIDNVLLFRESTLKGLPFIGHAQEIVAEHKADLLWINPLLSYYVGNPSDPEKSAEFTGALTKMQELTKVCTMLVHHTGKPKDSETMKSWSIDDFSYIGLGSSVWTNWARAILVLQSLKKPPGTFVLRFAKRGQRSGVINDDLEKVREIYIQHADEGLCWVPSRFCPDEEEKPTGGRPTKALWSRVNDAWDGMDKTPSELRQIIREVLSMSDKTASRAISKWTGIHIVKNNKDLWIKANP